MSDKVDASKFGIWYVSNEDVPNDEMNLSVKDGCVSLNKKERLGLAMLLLSDKRTSTGSVEVEYEYEDVTELMEKYMKENNLTFPNNAS